MDEIRVSDREASCDGCGREILDGEMAVMDSTGGGGMVLVCEACAPTALGWDDVPLLKSETATAIIVNRKGA